MYVGLAVIGMLLGGLIAATVARKKALKARPPIGYFVVGAMLPPVGIVLAALSKPEPPPGMRTVRCRRCNLRHTIDAAAGEWTCEQCHAVWGATSKFAVPEP